MSDHHHGAGCRHNHFDFSHISDARLKKWVTIAAIAVGVFLVAIKVFAWMVVGSISLLSSMADSILDVVSSGFNFWAVYHAMQPADKEHNFGHGKMEAVSALAQAIIMVFSALFILREGIERLLHPEHLHEPVVGMIVMGISIICAGGLVWFQGVVVKRTNSIAIGADALHYKADLFLNIGVLLSIFVASLFSFSWLDDVVGILIAGYIFYAAWKIGKHAFDILVDREINPKHQEEILKIVKGHSAVKGFHEFKSRSSGTKDFVQVHLEMDGAMSLAEAHKIALEVEKMVAERFPKVHLTIHQDPLGAKETHTAL